VNKSKRIFSLLLAIAILPATPALAVDNYTITEMPVLSGDWQSDVRNGDRKVMLSEDSQFTSSSDLKAMVPSEDGMGDAVVCTDVKAIPCSDSKTYRVTGRSLLPICTTKIESCIEELDVYKEGELPKEATFVKNIPGFNAPGHPEMNIPRSSTVSVFEAANAPHTGGSSYAVVAALDWSLESGFANIHHFTLRVAGVTEKPGPRNEVAMPGVCKPAPETVHANGHAINCGAGGTSRSGEQGCIYTLTDVCAKDQVLSPNTRITVKLKLTNALTGWFKGRLSSPVIKVTPINSAFNEVFVDASAVQVPTLATRYNALTSPDPLAKWGQMGGFGLGNLLYPVNGQVGIDVVDGLRKYAQDRASGVSSQWAVNTFTAQGNACLSDTSKLMGVVTTNAMAYLDDAPAWDGKSLNYKVAGMHYLNDGKTLAEGSYDLVLRSETARCLYGFSKAPINATIQVVGDNGESKVATTVVSEKDGWLHLAAYGFTFSSPTISVKLTQAGSTSTKKTTITCVKGKLTKKVTGVGPNCPAGYKKK
jgi:hypothetical protein